MKALAIWFLGATLAIAIGLSVVGHRVSAEFHQTFTQAPPR